MPNSGGERAAVPRWLRIATGMGVAMLLAIAVTQPARAATPLPDGRAYEMVSPSDKNGGEIMADSQRARAAADGSAVGFAALSGFSRPVSMGVSADYVSVRTSAAGTNGWATHALAPPQTAMPYVADTHFMEPAYWGEFSDDLSQGVFRSFSPVTNAPNVAQEQNLYLRTDLRSQGGGSYELLTDCPGCVVPFPPVTDPLRLDEQSFLAGASDDFGHVIFESRLPLTSDSTADPAVPNLNLFEWDHGLVRLAGILPDGACSSPPCAAPQSQAGRGATSALYTPHVISADGSRIFFTVSAASCSAVSTGCGDIYLRSDHATTVQVNVSEKTNGSGPGGTDGSGPQSAQYWNASRDGSRMFFVSQEALTNDAAESNERKLYMYTVSPNAQGQHLTFVSSDHEPADDGTTSDGVVGVIGVSDDGHTVYFVNSGGQLVPGRPLSISGIPNKVFRWHDGALEYVGGTTSGDQLQNLNESYVATPGQARVSPDGRYLLFSSERGTGLTGYNHGTCLNNGTVGGTCRELYLFRADSEPHLVCVSCNPTGARATAEASDVVHSGTGGAVVTYHLNHALADDGQRVFFSSAEALVAADQNRVSDAYEYDVAREAVYLLSSGTDPSPSYFMDASRDGNDVFILTRERLVGWDIDGGYDLYDVRVHGGMPDPVVRVICGPVTCRGAVRASPAALATVTEAAGGASSRPPRARRPVKRHCKPGLVPKKTGKRHCVKKAKPRRGTHRRVGR